jgi:hypothetical protein
MQILAAWVPAGYRLGVILHWRLPAPHELAREVDRSFMQLPTRPFCSPSACRTNEASMRHASACTMHGRRGGALVRLVPQRAATLGGGTPSGRPLPVSFPVPTFPPWTQPPGPVSCTFGALCGSPSRLLGLAGASP